MRYLAWLYLMLPAYLLAVPSWTLAQPIQKVRINQVRVGFPGPKGINRFKAAFWTPVYIDLEAGLDIVSQNDYEIVVESADSTDLQNIYVERRFLPTLQPREQLTVLAYVRTGNIVGSVNVSLRTPDGRTLSSMKPPLENYDPLMPSSRLYLALGSPLRGIKPALRKLNHPPGKGKPAGRRAPQQRGAAEEKQLFDEDDDVGSGHDVRWLASLDTVRLMPSQWYGYQTVDTIILTTGSEQFVNDLLEDRSDHLKALTEWVRRGGCLVISCARNQQAVAKILEKSKLIDCSIAGTVKRQRLEEVERWSSHELDPRKAFTAGGKDQAGDFEIARLVPHRGVDTLIAARDKHASPIMVQSGCGLGRVVLTAFDFDQGPFLAWNNQDAFWHTLCEYLEGEIAKPDEARLMPGRGFNTREAASNELAGWLQQHLELFPDVPVISFGWVALFILVYIIIIGPVDYLLLKKVIKRLELTWITFPTVVLVISVAAYFAAYAIKGNDLRINKVDIVDIDLSQPQVYGSTWFTLFSPRIQNYTIGVEPAAAWVGTPNSRRDYLTMVDWMGRPDNVWGGTSRAGSQGLFRRAYEYAPELAGLEGVPVQVWSSKSFAASWQAPPPATPLLEANLHPAANDPGKLSGTITSRLPVDLEDVVLLYKGYCYRLPAELVPGVPQRIDSLNLGSEQDDKTAQWFRTPLGQDLLTAKTLPPRDMSGTLSSATGSFMKSVLFHGNAADPHLNMDNTTLRPLNQYWRLHKEHAQEVMLFGLAKLPQEAAGSNTAEEITKSNLSSCQLWLGSLPDGSKVRPRLAGFLDQMTYVRVYIPVERR